MELYHEKRVRTPLDWLVLGVVVVIALIVIALSFQNTSELARKLELNPYLTAGLVEVLFGSLLFIRGKQRATQRNVPLFLSIGYFTSLGFVTAVNMYGLYQKSPLVGPIVGITISGAMWLMETVLVWLWVDSHKPHSETLRERLKKAKREIKEERIAQKIEWMKWESRKPDLGLIKKARKAEEARKQIEAEGLPSYFVQETPPPLVAPQKKAEIVPMKRPIGFHVELAHTKNEHQVSNTESPVATTIEHPPNTKSNTKQRTQNKTEKVIQYVCELIEKNEKFSVSSVANDMGCARSTASVAIREAKEKMMK